MAQDTPDRSVPTQQAFHRAITRGGNAWYAACLRITRNEALAHDAVQDALLSAWAKRGQFDGSAKLETWIHRIAINAALTLIRRRRDAAHCAPDDLPTSEPTPPEERDREEFGKGLALALGGLSDMERTCFVLKHIEQWRLAEIAAELSTGTGPVKQALFRAVRKLRTTMTPERRPA